MGIVLPRHDLGRTTDYGSERVEADADSGEYDDDSPDGIAAGVLTPAEAAQARDQGVSPSDYVQQEWGVDASDHASEHTLQRAISGGDGPSDLDLRSMDRDRDRDGTDDDLDFTADADAGSGDGGSGGDSTSGGSGTDVSDTEELAREVLLPAEAAKAQSRGSTAVQYLKANHGVDPADYPTERHLRQALSEGGSR